MNVRSYIGGGERESLTLLIPAAPPSANRLWRVERGRPRVSKEAKLFSDLVALAARGIRPPASWKFFRVEILVEPTRRSGDVDNKIKIVLDSLTHCGFWKDDSAVSFVSCEFGEVNKQGRTVVRISKGREKYLLPAAKPPIIEDW